MNVKLITSIFLLLILCSISHAEFNDDYIEIGYVDDNTKFIDHGVRISISKDIGNDIDLQGRYNLTIGEWDDPQEHESQKTQSTAIGISKNINFNKNTQIIPQVWYVYTDYKKQRDVTPICIPVTNCSPYTSFTYISGDYFAASLGIRHAFSDSFSGVLSYARTIPGSLEAKSNLFSSQLIKDISQNKSIVAEIIRNNAHSYKQYSLSIRHAF
jgi:hypothetical protein